MDRADKYQEIADRLYHVLKRELSDGHERFCGCEVCMVCMDYRAIRDVDTERVLPMSMAVWVEKPEWTYEQGQAFERRQAEPARQPTPDERELVRMYRCTVNPDPLGLLQRAAEAAMRTQSTNLEAQILAVPEEQRDQYHIRVQRHGDGTQTQHLTRNDAPRVPCTCAACYRTSYKVHPNEPTILRRLREMYERGELRRITLLYKDVSHLCLRAGDITAKPRYSLHGLIERLPELREASRQRLQAVLNSPSWDTEEE